MNKQSIEKQAVAKEALQYVKAGMLIGVGSGSTSECFIKELCAQRPNIQCVTTSLRSTKLLRDHFPIVNESLDTEIDITFDGADKIDLKNFCLIKGGGGALLREKLVALRSKKNIVLVDHTKLASPLFDHPLPIEIVQFGYMSTINRLKTLGIKGNLRTHDNKPVLSDNQNFIFDIDLQAPIDNPSALHEQLKAITGVVETGLFINTGSVAIIGYESKTEVIENHGK